jgi:hypothetical protein
MADAPREGISGVALSMVDALKTSPVLLLIVILNMAFAGGAAYYLTHIENMRSEYLKLLLDRCLPAKHEVQ